MGAVLLLGCGTEEVAPPTTIAFTSPAPDAAFTRSVLANSGALVAQVPIAIDTSEDIASVKLSLGEHDLGDVTDRRAATTVDVRALGAHTLTAIAYDADGAELLTTQVSVTVTEPMVADCKGWLDLYKLDYTSGPEAKGIADPVTVKVPINGVSYRYKANADDRKTLMGDCSLIKSLAQGAPIMREHGITTLVDIGVYNYRCIDQTKTPPNCSMSQHAYAKAIDIAGFEIGETFYDVNTDWIIDPDDNTCGGSTEGEKDTLLHKVICQLKAADVWNIVLTPNYNSAHRNHFHVDLSSGSDFIERLVGESLLVDMRPGIEPHLVD